MKNSSAVLQLLFLIIILQLSISFAQRQAYIVHIKDHRNTAKRSLVEIENTHFRYLNSVKNSEEEAKASLLYSYKNVINGFSAMLTEDEANKLSYMDGVVSVIKSEPISYTTQTTRSWEFTDSLAHGNFKIINGDEASSKQANHGKDVIVGLIDSGVWPESQSFNDEGMGPIPKSWKGICQSGVVFNSSHCNRKLIGARYYLKGYEAYYGPFNETADFRSARDRGGHGTHTASIVAGWEVPNASLFGRFGNGTAAGGATLARLAIYKVCWPVPGQATIFQFTCRGVDIFAAFDDAISDGVNVISISLGSSDRIPFFQDGIAFGALRASKRDIVVVASGGNSGPASATVENYPPWIFTVAASSIDRVFRSPLLLGNGLIIEGQTVTPYSLSQMYPFVFARDVEMPGKTDNQTTGLCLSGTLSPERAKGKIVLCFRGNSTNVEKGLEVKRAGGVGIVLQNPVDGMSVTDNAHVLPATTILSRDTKRIIDYIYYTKNPTARIMPVTTVSGSKPSPFMTGFSSTGPNPFDPNILKPDITAPGLNILAAWSEGTSVTNLFADNRVVKYNILSGTSMSCPHVAAAAALVKAAHPNWSGAAVRSALMTTAIQTNNIGLPITDAGGKTAATPFNYGSGHFQPSKAVDPGLVYDATYTDYLLYLCHFNSSVAIYDPSFTCPKDIPSTSDLNYPSVSASVGKSGAVTVKRTLTNVGNGASVYRVSVEAPAGYTVVISPETLNFGRVGERKSFNILIKVNGNIGNDHAFGWYTWKDGIHSVRSPIVVSR